MNRKVAATLILWLSVCQTVSAQSSNWTSAEKGKAFVYQHDSLIEINFLEGRRYFIDNLIRVPVDSFSVMSEPDRSVKHTNAHVISTADTTIISFSGSGIVYGLDSRGRPKRLDQTFFSGYNFQAFRGFIDRQLYSLGGTGFWHRHSIVTYYDSKLQEWEITRPFEGLPEEYTHLMGAQLDSTTFLLFNNPPREEEANPVDFDVYRVDFKERRAINVGVLSVPQRFKEQKLTSIGSLGPYAVFSVGGKLYVGDVRQNELFRWASGPVDAHPFDGVSGVIIFKDTLYATSSASTSSNPNKKWVKYALSNVLDACEPTGFALYESYSTLVLENYTAEFVFLSVAVLIIVIIIIRNRHRKTPKEKTFCAQLSKQERHLLNHLLKSPGKVTLNINEIDDLLGLNDKTWDNQRKIRSKVIQHVNRLSQELLGNGPIILRSASTEDRRVVRYLLSSEYFALSGKLLKYTLIHDHDTSPE